jgi:hypothetical protein
MLFFTNSSNLDYRIFDFNAIKNKSAATSRAWLRPFRGWASLISSALLVTADLSLHGSAAAGQDA